MLLSCWWGWHQANLSLTRHKKTDEIASYGVGCPCRLECGHIHTHFCEQGSHLMGVERVHIPYDRADVLEKL